jgi:23S rRNA (pseudouridine1915-N3)-methyltransferase
MKLTLCAVGKLGATSENNMARDYIARAAQTGRSLGLGPAELVEVEAKKGKSLTSPQLKAAEAEALRAALADAGVVITCDERGELLSSREIAARLEKFKDRGERRVAFVIGGADGLDAEFRKSAAFSLAFGPQTWPHALVRVMLAEQIYRAVTILAGLPYHRD